MLLFCPLKAHKNKSFRNDVYETGKTILIDYALTNSAVKRYQTVP